MPCSPGLALHVPRKVTPGLPAFMALEQDFSGSLSEPWLELRYVHCTDGSHSLLGGGAQTPSQEVLPTHQSLT